MKRGYIVAACVWTVVGLLACAMIYRLAYKPYVEKVQANAKQEEKSKILATAQSQYKYKLNFGLDGFSGYSVLRSQEFQNHLRRANVKVDLVADNADYVARLKALQSGDLQMAAFTIDALIIASAKIKDTPAAIVGVIDETRGADAMIAYNKAFANVDAINDPQVRFVATPNSPSETFARVVMASFKFDRLEKNPFIFVDGAEEVFKKYRQSRDNEKLIYVVWQPYGTKILDNPNTHILLDSSKFKGYIVDVIVCNLDFLYKNPEVARLVLESYFRANYDCREKMVQLVTADAKDQNQPLSQKQAEELVKGIWWKNTQENYGHFGLGSHGLQHIEDMIHNLTTVLVKTNAIEADPTNGHPEQLYRNDLLANLHTANFYPGFASENVRNENEALPTLNDEQWTKLVPVGTLEVPQLTFARGTARLSEISQSHLDTLHEKLKTFPTYYVLIRGNAASTGDMEAAKTLALQRAEAARDYLLSKGITAQRIKAVAGEPSGETSVNFVLGETTY